jgi:hypothetical protein
MINLKDRVKITTTCDGDIVTYNATLTVTSKHSIDTKYYRGIKDVELDIKNQLLRVIHRELYGDFYQLLYEKISNLVPWKPESFGDRIDDLLKFVRKLERCEPISNDKGVL